MQLQLTLSTYHEVHQTACTFPCSKHSHLVLQKSTSPHHHPKILFNLPHSNFTISKSNLPSRPTKKPHLSHRTIRPAKYTYSTHQHIHASFSSIPSPIHHYQMPLPLPSRSSHDTTFPFPFPTRLTFPTHTTHPTPQYSGNRTPFCRLYSTRSIIFIQYRSFFLSFSEKKRKQLKAFNLDKHKLNHNKKKVFIHT